MRYASIEPFVGLWSPFSPTHIIFIINCCLHSQLTTFFLLFHIDRFLSKDYVVFYSWLILNKYNAANILWINVTSRNPKSFSSV